MTEDSMTTDSMTTDSMAGDPSDNTTLTAILASYEQSGFTANHGLTDDGEFRCGACRELSAPDQVRMKSLRRLEGASNPDEMQAVVAAHCPRCDAAGLVVVAYGPTARPEEADFLSHVEDGRYDDEELPSSSAPNET
jgi:hypothetical protein